MYLVICTYTQRALSSTRALSLPLAIVSLEVPLSDVCNSKGCTISTNQPTIRSDCLKLMKPKLFMNEKFPLARSRALSIKQRQALLHHLSSLSCLIDFPRVMTILKNIKNTFSFGWMAFLFVCNYVDAFSIQQNAMHLPYQLLHTLRDYHGFHLRLNNSTLPFCVENPPIICFPTYFRPSDPVDGASERDREKSSARLFLESKNDINLFVHMKHRMCH